VTWFKTASAVKPVKSFSLGSAPVIEEETKNTNMTNVIHILAAGKHFNFQAANPEEMREWIDVFESVRDGREVGSGGGGGSSSGFGGARFQTLPDFPSDDSSSNSSSDSDSDYNSDSDSKSGVRKHVTRQPTAPAAFENPREDDAVGVQKASYSTYAQISPHGCCASLDEGQEFLIATHSVEITDDIVFFHYEGDLGPLEAALAKIRQGCCASMCGGGRFTASSATQSVAIRRSDIVIVKNANQNETLYENPSCCSGSCNCAWMVCYKRAEVTLREEGSTTLMLVCRGTTAEQPLYVQAPINDALRLVKVILADSGSRPRAQVMEQ
jgi:hypothetical protein